MCSPEILRIHSQNVLYAFPWIILRSLTKHMRSPELFRSLTKLMRSPEILCLNFCVRSQNMCSPELLCIHFCISSQNICVPLNYFAFTHKTDAFPWNTLRSLTNNFLCKSYAILRYTLKIFLKISYRPQSSVWHVYVHKVKIFSKFFLFDHCIMGLHKNNHCHSGIK